MEEGKEVTLSFGSLDEEIIDVSKSLDISSRKIRDYQRRLEEEKSILEVTVKARTKELEELTQSLEVRVKERTKHLEETKKELQERVEELEKFHKVTVGRELKMMELKKEIGKLKEKD